jgi:hypothetical protein
MNDLHIPCSFRSCLPKTSTAAAMPTTTPIELTWRTPEWWSAPAPTHWFKGIYKAVIPIISAAVPAMPIIPTKVIHISLSHLL